MSSDKILINREHKERIEKRYGKSLKEVMYEMVVDRNLDQWEGSEELGISKDLFVTWRTQFRLGPMQRAADWAEERKNEKIKRYQNELEKVNLSREFVYKSETSLRGFKEMIERLIEVQKQKEILSQRDATSNLSMIVQLGILEGVIDYINNYEEDNLLKKLESEIHLLEWLTSER